MISDKSINENKKMSSLSKSSFHRELENENDAEEQNPDIIRAEMMAMTTPLALEYSDKFYSSLKNIEMSCSAEVQMICGDSTKSMSDMNISQQDLKDPSFFQYFLIAPADSSVFDPIGSSRRLAGIVQTAIAYKANGLELMTSLSNALIGISRKEKKSIVNKLENTIGMNKISKSDIVLGPLPVPVPVPDLAVDTQSVKRAQSDIILGPLPVPVPVPDLAVDTQSVKRAQSDIILGPLPVPVPIPDSVVNKQSLRGQLPHSRKLFSHHDSDTESDSDEEVENSASRRHHHGHHQSHRQPKGHLGGPDESFAGALGFGNTRDLCLYENFDKVSSPCQSAVIDHFKLRQEYWSRESDLHVDRLSIFLWASLLVLAFFAFRRFVSRDHHRKVKKIMDAIRNNPSLKASVEAESGIAVPEKKCCRGKAICRGIFLVFLTFVSTLLIALSSLLFTVSILTAITPDASNPPSVSFAVSVLIGVGCAELCLFYFILRGCRCHPVNSESQVAASSFTPQQSVVQTDNNCRFARYLSWIPASRNRALKFLNLRRVGDEGYYTLVCDESTHGVPQTRTEMVSLSSEHGHSVSHQESHYTPFVVTQRDVEMTAAQPMSQIQMF